MDSVERSKLKTLANDAIIDLFGQETRELRLAEGLERVLEELVRRARCPICGDGDNPDWDMVTNVFGELGLRMEVVKEDVK